TAQRIAARARRLSPPRRLTMTKEVVMSVLGRDTGNGVERAIRASLNAGLSRYAMALSLTGGVLAGSLVATGAMAQQAPARAGGETIELQTIEVVGERRGELPP